MLKLQLAEGWEKTETVATNGSKNRKRKIVERQVRDQWCTCKTSSSLEKKNSINVCVKHCF